MLKTAFILTFNVLTVVVACASVSFTATGGKFIRTNGIGSDSLSSGDNNFAPDAISPAFATPSLTFTGINATGSSGNGITSGSLNYGQTGVVLYGFSVQATTPSSTLQSIQLTNSTIVVSNYFSGFQLYRSTTNNYTTGTLTAVGSAAASNGQVTISSLNEAFTTAAQPKYYFLVANYSIQGSTPTSVQFDYNNATVTNNASIVTSSTAGNNFTLAAPVLSYAPSTTGVTTSPIITKNSTSNVFGFTLSTNNPTNMHALLIDISFPQGGSGFTSGYINSVSLYNASTNTVVSGVTVNNDGDHLELDWGGATLNGTTSYYIQASFNSFPNGAPPAFSMCINSADNPASNVCQNPSNCTIPGTSSACGSTYYGFTGTIYYWTGVNYATNSNWSNNKNWTTTPASPSTAASSYPGTATTDMACIGTYDFHSNFGGNYFYSEPNLDASQSIYILQVGNYKAVTLTANSNTLTVTNGMSVSSSSTYPFVINAATSNTANTLVLGGASTIGTSAYLTMGSTTVTSLSTSATLTNSGTYTLASDSHGSASIAALPSGASVSGTVSVQRYITGGSGYRGYRMLSSPVYSGTVTNGAVTSNVYSINYLQNSCVITGASGGGFDRTGNPTLYLYREDLTPSNATFTSGNFWGISAINNQTAYNYYLNGGTTSYNIPAGAGYLFFFRGDKAAFGTTALAISNETVTTYVPTNTTLTATGTLNQGQVVVTDWYTPSVNTLAYTGTGTGTNSAVRGFNFVGNPYASSINWDLYSSSNTSSSAIYAPNIDGSVYIFDPKSKNYGVYKAGAGGNGTHNTTNIIPSGQGFFIRLKSAANNQLIFNESAKSSVQVSGTKLLMGVPLQQAVTQELRLKLILDSLNTDDTVIGFNSSASTAYNSDEDAAYLPGDGSLESLTSLSSDNVRLAINFLPLPKQTPLTIRLTVNASQSGLYTFQKLALDAVPQIYEVWLMDKYKADSLDLRNNSTYAFNIDVTDTNSYKRTRFSLVIRQNPALGVHLLNFIAAKATGGAQVTWKTENEENYTNFTVERSTDNGVTFSALGGFVSSALGTYTYLDKNPAASNQYRLKLEDLNGTITYSNVVTLMYQNIKSIAVNHISVYPNPTSNTLNLAINLNNTATTTASTTNSSALQTLGTALSVPLAQSSGPALYGIKIFSITGSVVKSATSASSSWQDNVSSLSPGTYIIQVVNNSDNSLIGKSTFIKM